MGVFLNVPCAVFSKSKSECNYMYLCILTNVITMFSVNACICA